MTFEIQHFSLRGQHITLKVDGSIEIYINEDNKEPIIIPYLQARILKLMILVEKELEGIDK